jgi:hypothetical protein
LARQDKERRELEKSLYEGPWKVSSVRKEMITAPDAPKPPISAFLAFSNKNGAVVTKAEVSRVLAEMWKDAPQDKKQPYVDEEGILREKYKIEMAKWREKKAKDEAAHRKVERTSPFGL